MESWNIYAMVYLKRFQMPNNPEFVTNVNVMEIILKIKWEFLARVRCGCRWKESRSTKKSNRKCDYMLKSDAKKNTWAKKSCLYLFWNFTMLHPRLFNVFQTLHCIISISTKLNWTGMNYANSNNQHQSITMQTECMNNTKQT